MLMDTITLTKKRYAWQPRYVRDFTAVFGTEEWRRERRLSISGKAPRTARRRIELAEWWLTRKLRRMGWQVIPGTAREVYPAIHEPPRSVSYDVRAFEKPERLTWDDASAISHLQVWHEPAMAHMAVNMGVPA